MRKSKPFIIILLLVLFVGRLSAQPDFPDTLFFKDRFVPLTADQVMKTEGYYNWGASIIRGEDGRYHLFYSRWPKELTFTAWLTHSEIAHAVSDSPAGPWTYVETVMTSRGSGHWDAITAHNPKIKQFGDRYYLYYVSTNLGDRDYTEAELMETARVGYSHPNWAVLRPNQRTGVAVSESLNGPWKRQEQPLIEPSGPIVTLTVNPAVTQGHDGRYYLVVKGDKPNETRFIRNQAIAVSDHPAGPFDMLPDPVIGHLDTEDMSIWYDQKRRHYYGVFHAHSFIGMVSSRDGVNWKKATEYVVFPKKLRMKDGSEIHPDRLERPFVYTENGEPQVLCLAVKKGDESYTVFVPVQPKTRPIPNARQLAWQEAEMGAVFHYDLHVFDNKPYNQAENRIVPVDDYQIFQPDQLDTDQWIRAARDAGFTFAILTATHETGFALFQSEVNPYSMKALNYQNGQGDIVRDFVNSCRKYGLKPGVYVGLRWNSFFGVHNFRVNGEGPFRDNRQAYYNHMVEGMVRELCTQYGELFEIWFDGGADHPDNGAPDVLPIVQQYQPNCLFYHNSQLAEARWGGSESGMVPYPCWATFPGHYSHASDTHADQFHYLKHGDPAGSYWMPAMSDAPLRGYNGRHEWFWEPGDEAHIFPLENLMRIYEQSVGHNSTLIMGLTPAPDGLLPEPDVERLREWGAEIRRRFGNPVQSWTAPKGYTHPPAFDQPLILENPENDSIRYLVVREDIRFGERIRGYRIEARIDGVWTLIGEGSCIGNKRIHPLKPGRYEALRLTITGSDGAAYIRSAALY